MNQICFRCFNLEIFWAVLSSKAAAKVLRLFSTGRSIVRVLDIVRGPSTECPKKIWASLEKNNSALT